MLDSSVFGKTTFRTRTCGMSRWGALSGVFGTFFCCLGLTQTGPCPFGGRASTCDATHPCAERDCRVAACTSGKCVYSNTAADTACGDDTVGACDGADTCDANGECQDNVVAENGACLSGQDTNSCTNDVCIAGACTHPPVANATPCGDATDNACTAPDTCIAGVCEANDVANPTANPAVFADPNTSFCTDEVHDVDGEIVRFDPVAKTIIWAADGTRFQEGLWDVNGVLLQGGGFTVAFGTEGGERRAYFTLTADGFICDISLGCGGVCIAPTTVAVPQE